MFNFNSQSHARIEDLTAIKRLCGIEDRDTVREAFKKIAETLKRIEDDAELRKPGGVY